MANKLKSPGFKLYIESFLHGTKHMTAEEVGGYILLLCHQWDDGFIPDDLEQIKLLSKCGENSLKKILAKFKKNKRGLANNRLERERKKQKENAKKSQQNGIKGGRPIIKKINPEITNPVILDNPENNPSYSISISNSINNKGVGEIPIQPHPIVIFSKALTKVSKLESQLTNDQAEKLIIYFGESRVKGILESMENYKPLNQKYSSVYMTARKWIERDLKQEREKQGQTGTNLTGLYANG